MPPTAAASSILYRPSGCTSAATPATAAVSPLFEVMTMTDEIAMLVGAPTREIEAMAVVAGHVHAARGRRSGSAVAGITTLDEVRRVAGDAVG